MLENYWERRRNKKKVVITDEHLEKYFKDYNASAGICYDETAHNKESVSSTQGKVYAQNMEKEGFKTA